MHEATSPRRINSPRAVPGPSRCSWPRNSSSVRGRIRAASGSEWRRKSVGSDTGGTLTTPAAAGKAIVAKPTTLVADSPRLSTAGNQANQIGRASCRERVENQDVGGVVKKKSNRERSQTTAKEDGVT